MRSAEESRKKVTALLQREPEQPTPDGATVAIKPLIEKAFSAHKVALDGVVGALQTSQEFEAALKTARELERERPTRKRWVGRIFARLLQSRSESRYEDATAALAQQLDRVQNELNKGWAHFASQRVKDLVKLQEPPKLQEFPQRRLSSASSVSEFTFAQIAPKRPPRPERQPALRELVDLNNALLARLNQEAASTQHQADAPTPPPRKPARRQHW